MGLPGAGKQWKAGWSRAHTAARKPPLRKATLDGAMGLPARSLACFLSTALLLAAALPCPTVWRAGVGTAPRMAHSEPAATHAGHAPNHVVQHVHHAASPGQGSASPCHEPPELSAPCPCGCGDRAGTAATGSDGRLGPVLLSNTVAADASRGALPVPEESPRIPGEPRFAPDPIPI